MITLGFGINSASFENQVSIQTTHIDSPELKGNEDVLANGITEEIQFLVRLTQQGI